MGAILIKATGFLLIICTGYLMKRKGIFSVDDSNFLTKLIMRVTLPCAIILGFRTLEISKDLLFVTLIGFGLSWIMIGAALLAARKKSPTEKAFFILNTAGYNIGNFAIPFAQAFFPPAAVAVICMFDVGNALMGFGFTFALAKYVSSGEKTFSLKNMVKTLSKSIPFLTYVFMVGITAVGLRLPEEVYTVVSMFSSANSFLAMLLIGIIFAVKMEKKDVANIIEILLLRLSFSFFFAWVAYAVLPFDTLVKQVLMIVVFAPIVSIAPVYSEQCGYDKSVAAVLNSLAIPISMIAMTVLLLHFQF